MHNNRNDSMSGEQIDGIEAQSDVTKILLGKRGNLTKQLNELNSTIDGIQQEYLLLLNRLQAQKKPLEDALRHIDALLRFEGYYSSDSPNAGIDSALFSISARTSITDSVFNLLQESQQPMHYKDIAVRLQETNTYIPGKDPAATLLSRMSRDNRFIRTEKRGTYALSTWLVHSTKTNNGLTDVNTVNSGEMTRNKPPYRQAITFARPWNQASLFVSGIFYGKN